MRISEILNQTQYFFDSLASDSVKMNKIGNIVARDKFLEGLERLGVSKSHCMVIHTDRPLRVHSGLAIC